jgi:hypothetical protein
MQSRQQDSRDERPLGELFADLAREIGDLMRQELTLARTEMTQKATRVGRNIGTLAVGGAVVYAGFLALVAAAILVLAAIGVPWWLSALVSWSRQWAVCSSSVALLLCDRPILLHGARCKHCGTIRNW